jgi:hypothetical protein
VQISGKFYFDTKAIKIPYNLQGRFPYNFAIVAMPVDIFPR